jgi:hypothetical protein
MNQISSRLVTPIIRHIAIFLIALAAVGLSTSAALAASAWETKAKKLFENDEYTDVIELAEPHRKDNLGAMFLAFSHLQEFIFNGTKYDKEKFKNYKLYLEAKLTAVDIDDLLYFVNLDDKPEVVREARRLSSSTFKNIKQIEDVPKLVKFLKSNDEESRKLALSSIKRIVELKRKYVDKGGTLRDKDVKIMGSSRLIIPLLEQAADEKDARRTLVLIEEPVLKYIGKYVGPQYVDIEESITKAMTKRVSKYPDSNWYSAVGKVR